MSEVSNNLRGRLLATKKCRTKVISIFDEEIELRQPTVKQVMELSDTDNRRALATVLINQAYVPGTDEKIFQDADYESILDWPVGDWLTSLTSAIEDLTGVNVDAARKNSSETA